MLTLGVLRFDADLVANSEKPVETLMKVRGDCFFYRLFRVFTSFAGRILCRKCYFVSGTLSRKANIVIVLA